MRILHKACGTFHEQIDDRYCEKQEEVVMWHFIRDNSGLRTGVNAYKGSGRMTVVVSAICLSISQLNDAT